MFERIFLLAFLLLLTYLFVKKINFNKITANQYLSLKINNLNPVLPTIVYFWTDECIQCKTIQKPDILKLQKEGNKFNLVSLNAIKELKLTKQISIKTVPSTVV
jgi:thioredoxin-like negative regulator of GroEL